MISMMDMTTGRWDNSYTAPDARLASDASSTCLADYKANPPQYAGLCEYATARPLYAGMPVALATQDLDDFFARMDGFAL